ncbi:hypothetical protein EB061_10190, partial [bacterium]|nr:hypothetical protein [bacterium]
STFSSESIGESIMRHALARNAPAPCMHLALPLIGLLVQSCAMPLDGTRVDTPQSYSMDGVKLISPQIQRGDDPSTFGQNHYTLSPTQRLLLRFESLSSKVAAIQVSGGKKVEFEVTPTDPAQLESAKASLSLCPLTQNWMMLATWENAHPFGNNGQWSTAGGDYEPLGCVRAARTEGDSLFFDITRWVIDYPRGRNENFGQLLLSDSNQQIFGEKSGSHSPRIHWLE